MIMISDIDGAALWINRDQIVSIERMNKGIVKVHFSDRQWMLVRSTESDLYPDFDVMDGYYAVKVIERSTGT